jgi:hypothetical protein
VLAFLAGLAILRVLAIIPIVGGIVWFAATVVGLGALLVATWRRGATTPSEPAPRRPEREARRRGAPATPPAW